MNLSAEKRKMPRMQVGLSACIIWGIAKNRSEVNIRDLSIHGISFCAPKYFTSGTQFDLILPMQKQESEPKEIQAEVVRCKTLTGYSSSGHFEVGAKFSFISRRSADPENKPVTETLTPFQPTAPENFHPKNYDERLIDERLINDPFPENTVGTLGSSSSGIRFLELNAEFIRSVRTSKGEETVVTRIQVKQARLISSASVSPTRATIDLKDNTLKFLSSKVANKNDLF